jgi:hypothetical protein
MIFLVLSVIQLSNPQTTQAKANTLLLSAITKSVDFNVCTAQKRSVNCSPSSASLTIISQSILSASKQWIGNPEIFINKLEKSTQLLIGLEPKSINCKREKKSDFLTSTLLIPKAI